MWLIILLIAGTSFALPDDDGENESETSRKILGSSVVTSVSVIMDTGNGTKTVYTDAVGRPQSKPSSPSELASPIELLNPDRYEFYTFDDNGDLVKRLMSLKEIKGIIATGDSDGFDLDPYTSQGFVPEKKVNDIVSNVQNVLKEEMEFHKLPSSGKPVFDTPDVSDSWSMILPAVFGNSGQDIKPEKPIAHVTADTIMIEPNMQNSYSSTPAPQKIDHIRVTTSKKPIPVSYTTPRSSTPASTPRSTPVLYTSSPKLPLSTVTLSQLTTHLENIPQPMLNVEIFSNSHSSTRRPIVIDQYGSGSSPMVQVHPLDTTTKKTTISNLMHYNGQVRPVTVLPKPESIVPNSMKPVITSSVESTLPTKKPTALSTTPYFTTVKPSQVSLEAESVTLPISKFNVVSKGSTLPTTINKYVSSTPSITSTSSFPGTSKITVQQWLSSTNFAPLLLLTPPPHSSTGTSSSISTNAITTSQISSSTSSSSSTSAFTTSPNTSGSTSSSISTSALTTSPQISSSTSSSNSSSAFTTSGKPLISNSQVASPTLNLVPTKDVSSSENEKVPTISTEPYELTTTENSPLRLTTFTIVDNNKKGEITTAANDYEKTDTTIKNDSLEELLTEGTEYLTQKNPTTLKYYSTDVSLHEALSTDQKISASELLDQLLFTTNIYEINTELAQKVPALQLTTQYDTKTTTSPQEQNPTVTVLLPETTTEPIYTVTYKDEPTTDQTLLQSIEQLLSQAVDGVQETIISTGPNNNVQDILTSAYNNNVLDNIEETATSASELVASNKESLETTTEENSLEEVITSSSTNNLGQSVSSLLSQVYETPRPSLTTLPLVTTEKYPLKTTVISNRKAEEDATVSSLSANSTTSKAVELLSTTLSSNSGTEFSNIIIKQDDLTTDNLINNSENVPHIINITIIHAQDTKNSTNPPKTDSRLEEYEIDTDETTTIEYEKNTAKSPNKTAEDISELLTTEESSTLQQTSTNDANYLYDVTTQISSKNADITQASENEEATEANESTTNNYLDLLQTTSERRVTILSENERDPVTEVSTNIKADLTTSQVGSDQSTLFTQINEETSVATTEDLETDTVSSSNNPVISTSAQPLKPISFIPTAIVPQKVYKRPDPKPSIVITINENSTFVTENGKPVYPKVETASQILISNAGAQNVSNDSTKMKESSSTNINNDENTWTLVSTVAPHSNKESVGYVSPTVPEIPPEINEQPVPVNLVPKPMQGFGLEDSTAQLDTDVYQFAQLCNELAFGFWKIITGSVSSVRSVFVSPFSATSLLAMVFLGARGATSNEMNEILKLDDMVTFNPHLIFKNVSESVGSDPDSGIATSVIIRELFSDRSKGKLLDFYKNRARAFYDGYVEEVGFREIGDVIRRRSNLLVKKYTNGKISEFLKDSSITARPPLAGISLNIFQTDCTQGSTEDRDGELYFVVLPSIRQRRLVPIPAVVFKSGFLAGYEPSLDATAIALGTKDHVISTIFVVPGQQGIAAHGDGLARLEKRLVESSFKKGAWSRLLRSLVPRPGLEVQIPRFSHRSVINATVTLEKMGLHELFDADKADLRGLNGVANELHLSDMLQVNSFATCGENRIADTHHSEIYPANVQRSRVARLLINANAEIDTLEEPRDYQRSFHDPSYDPGYLSLPLPLRPRQARVPESPRLKFDRPFLYFVRHNPTGLILHMGRFNPRLLP